MSNANPLQPQGSLSDNQLKGKSNVRIAAVTIIAVHLVFFGGLLMQGCQRDSKTGTDLASTADTNKLVLPPMEATNLFYTNAASLPAESPATNITPPVSNTPIVMEPQTNPIPATPTPETKEYVVARGDSLYKIANANRVSIRDLTRANPNVDPARLQVGQKLQIPAPANGNPATGGITGENAGMAANTATTEKTHTVKAGETLTKIARQHGTTIKTLRSVNNLKTDRLLVGQKLKIPTRTLPAATNTEPIPATGTINTIGTPVATSSPPVTATP